ncbi:MAG TPA: diguanylate cyclase [Candidatus Limnocylindrales bacterium]|nr:diguanylate cyclase [Candidatus Limnocylindrales bacterium]
MARLLGILALAAAVGIGILLMFAPEVMAPWVEAPVRPAISALVAACLGVILTSILVRAHMGYRFDRLVKAAERIASGDYTAYVTPRGGAMETRLAQAVNDIAAALVDTHDRATFDRLTGVANRQSLLAALFAETERASRYGRPLSVAFVDIDHFKTINDTYGHAVGDIVLRGVAQALAANLRTSDMIGRYGGEEFMLILTETNIEEGAVLTEKLRTLVQRQRFAIEGAPEITVTISIGIAGGSGTKLRMDTLVRDADAAMYSAKSLGRNQTYVFAEPDDDARVPRAPISAAGRARAVEIGQRAREAATAALTSVLAPLPHYRGQPSPLIASIVVSLARQLQLSDAEIDRLRVAALLHDVGKVAVPEEILEKPSALTSAEWRTVVQHPRIGQVILEQAAALKDAVPIILHHHERFAGHGYPFGLRANEIPLGARIVAIADAYDAMINDRPYKLAISHEQAVAELRRHAGTQFDPELVELFCDMYADHAPEPDATVVAMAAGHTAHHPAAALVLPEPAASRVQRKRRRPESSGDAAAGESQTMGPDGSIGIAPGRVQMAPMVPPARTPARGRRSDTAAG